MLSLATLGVLLFVAIPLVAVAHYWRIPYPIVLVVGGLAVGFFAHLARAHPNPHDVLLLFLPPLLFAEALAAPLQQMRERIVWIGSLALVLVLLTAAVVTAITLYVAPWMTLPAAVLLGAVIAPTDAVAAAPVAARLGVARRTLAILRGEALLNDAAALVLYAAAFAAVVAGGFQAHVIAQNVLLAIFVSPIVGGGLAAVAAWGWHRVREPHLQTAINILLPWVAYILADRVGASGVIAVVTAGFVVNARAPRDMLPSARLISNGFWETTVFLVNAVVFLMIGTALHASLVVFRETHEDAVLIVAVVAAVILTRIVWVTLMTLGLQIVRHTADWRESSVVAWCGMRGGVSAALALALPPILNDRAFIERDTIVLVTFAVIFFTLLGQGATLPPLLRRLFPHSTDESAAQRRLIASESPALYAQLERLDDAAIAGQREIYARLSRERRIDDVTFTRVQNGFDLIESGRRVMLEGNPLEDEAI